MYAARTLSVVRLVHFSCVVQGPLVLCLCILRILSALCLHAICLRLARGLLTPCLCVAWILLTHCLCMVQVLALYVLLVHCWCLARAVPMSSTCVALCLLPVHARRCHSDRGWHSNYGQGLLRIRGLLCWSPLLFHTTSDPRMCLCTTSSRLGFRPPLALCFCIILSILSSPTIWWSSLHLSSPTVLWTVSQSTTHVVVIRHHFIHNF